MKKSPLTVTGAIVLFFITRLLYLFFLKEHFISTNVKLLESQYIGLIAKHLSEGLIMPFWDYQFSSYDGGMLIAGAALTPFFLLLGQTSFALSFYAVTVSLAVFVLWWRFAAEFFGSRVSRYAAVLFLFAPPIHVITNSIAGGTHMEISLFFALVVYFFFRIFYVPGDGTAGDVPRAATKDVVLLGFFSGLGIYYSYSLAVLLFSCFLFWCTLDKSRMSPGQYGGLALAFLAGISGIFFRLNIFKPLIMDDIVRQWPTANIAETVPRLTSVLFRQLPDLFSYHSSAHILMYLLFPAAYGFLAARSRTALQRQVRGILHPAGSGVRLDDRNKIIFFLLFVAVYLLIYTFSNFNVPADRSMLRLRYLLVLYPFIFMIMAAALAGIREGGWRYGPSAVRGLLVYAVAASVCAGAGKLDFHHAGQKIQRRLLEKGYSHEMLGTVICFRYGEHDPGTSLALLDRLAKRYQPAAYKGFGYEYAMMGFSDYKKYLGKIDYKPAAIEYYKGYKTGQTVLQYLKGTDLAGAYMTESVAADVCRDPEHLGRNLLDYITAVPASDRSGYYKGIGLLMAFQCDVMEDRTFHFMENAEPRYVRAFYEGVTEGKAYIRNSAAGF